MKLAGKPSSAASIPALGAGASPGSDPPDASVPLRTAASVSAQPPLPPADPECPTPKPARPCTCPSCSVLRAAAPGVGSYPDPNPGPEPAPSGVRSSSAGAQGAPLGSGLGFCTASGRKKLGGLLAAPGGLKNPPAFGLGPDPNPDPPTVGTSGRAAAGALAGLPRDTLVKTQLRLQRIIENVISRAFFTCSGTSSW